VTAAPVIWYVHHYAGGPGVGRFYRPFELAQSWQSKGVNAVVITAAFHHILNVPGSRKGLHNIDGVPYEFLPTPSYKGNGLGRLINMATFSAQVWRYAKGLVLRHGAPNMIIGSSPHPFIFLATHQLAKRFNAVSVFEVRDLWPLSITALLNVSAKHPLLVWMERVQRYAYKRADAVVSLLPETLPYMVQRGLDDVRRWHYIPNGVNMLQTARADIPSDALIQAQQWRKEGRFVLVYPGALGVPNNLLPLIQAMELLRARDKNRIAVVIVGRGEQEQKIKSLIVQKQLQDHIALYPQITKEAVFSLLQHVDAGYMSVCRKPELYQFGISLNKLYDYMRFKLPIIYAIESGNNPVRDCQCGYSATPDNPSDIADALFSLTKLSVAERQAMGERGYKYGLQHHHYQNLADKYLQIIQ